MNIYEYILLYNLIYIYTIWTLYIYELYVFCLLQQSQLVRTMVTLVSHSHDLFQLVLIVETAYTTVNMIQVINKEARAT